MGSQTLAPRLPISGQTMVKTSATMTDSEPRGYDCEEIPEKLTQLMVRVIPPMG